MTSGVLLWLMVAVSATSLVLQSAALAHMLRQQAASTPERLAGRGYVRTAGCRVAAAGVYVTVALLQVTGVRINGSGGLSPESLVIFSGVQTLWLANAGMDIIVRRKLSQHR